MRYLLLAVLLLPIASPAAKRDPNEGRIYWCTNGPGKTYASTTPCDNAPPPPPAPTTTSCKKVPRADGKYDVRCEDR